MRGPNSMKEFKIFVADLIKLGFGAADPELLLWHIAFTATAKDRADFLSHERWKTRYYNRRIPAGDIILRYEHFLNIPWVEKKIKEFRAAERLASN